VTFSICVHESYETGGTRHHRFGVAVTTRRPSIGSRCPFVTEDGAIATQSATNPSLGRKGLEYVADGLAIDDAITALLTADPAASTRQVHGVSRDGTITFSGDDCDPWTGHVEGADFTVAGNMLVGEGVLSAVESAYRDRDRSTSLSQRLIRCLKAGHEAGGDKRHDRPIQSAAVRVRNDESDPFPAFHNDLRVDASETPIADLESAYRDARRSPEDQ